MLFSASSIRARLISPVICYLSTKIILSQRIYRSSSYLISRRLILSPSLQFLFLGLCISKERTFKQDLRPFQRISDIPLFILSIHNIDIFISKQLIIQIIILQQFLRKVLLIRYLFVLQELQMQSLSIFRYKLISNNMNPRILWLFCFNLNL